ncbi:bud site selection protein 6 [Trichomonascus vanleenenianus]|uniref:formin-mediated actin nucleation enhancer n=1 Tax=Trichomonascus vanleenenianus TaxID=2268995 RepID=UPI003ECAC95D
MMHSSSPMSTIESTVTRLLVATKKLLESLTQWARGDASEQDVSDVYVNLGNEFNVACRAFLSAGVEVADLGDVPQALRVILEKALSEDASQENLDRYLPSIREIIVNLLRQLKEKQTLIRNSRHGSTSSAGAQLGPLLPPQPHAHAAQQPAPQHPGASSLPHPPVNDKHPYPTQRKNSVPAHSQSSPSLRQMHDTRSMAAAAADRSSVSTDSPHPPPKDPRFRSQSASKSSSVLPRKDNNANALAALQRGEALERRASRRFSAYQFAKLGNAISGGSQSTRDSVPDLPPLPTHSTSSNRTSLASFLPTKTPHSSSRAEYTTSTTSDSIQSSPLQTNGPKLGESPELREESSVAEPFDIFLQIGRRVKKATVEPEDVTIASLRLLFIDRFAYSPGTDQFPDIYLQDPQSGIRYEIDEKTIGEVGSGSLLSLNVEAMDEVKKHFDEGLAALTKSVDEMHRKIESNAEDIKKIVESAASTPRLANSSSTSLSPQPNAASESEIKRSLSTATAPPLRIADSRQIEQLRHDLSVVRQISISSLASLREDAVRIISKTQHIQSAQLPISQARAYMENCHKKLSSDSDNLLTSVDDIQDIIEALRKDVAQRGVRHSPQQLQSVSKELAEAKKDLDKMTKYILQERTGWKKIWERELDTVCEEQQFFKLQEELVADLQDDLQKASETFALVEQCSTEQVKLGKKDVVLETTPVDGIVHAKDAVLIEVQGLQPNHEERVEAIERAEKLRKKELEMRGLDPFKRELGEFVTEGKLKKSGGVEETERKLRQREMKMREEQRKHDEEAQKLREDERERKREEKDKKKKEKKEKKDKKEKKKKKKNLYEEDGEGELDEEQRQDDDDLDDANGEVDKTNQEPEAAEAEEEDDEFVEASDRLTPNPTPPPPEENPEEKKEDEDTNLPPKENGEVGDTNSENPPPQLPLESTSEARNGTSELSIDVENVKSATPTAHDENFDPAMSPPPQPRPSRPSISIDEYDNLL